MFISSAAAPQRKYRFPLRKARILPASPNFVCDGRMETSGEPNVPQTYPRTMIPVLRKLLTKPEREGGWAQAIFVA